MEKQVAKIDIFSGFLGAGKTTLIKKLLKEAYAGEKVVLIENEFGEIGIDGGFLQDAGIEITEMNSGCICCSLVGDFTKALAKVLEEYTPDRVIIEPSGVGKLSDVIRAVRNASEDELSINCFATVADVNKVKMYMKNFGEFYNDQIEHASAIVLSHTDRSTDEKIVAAIALIKEKNSEAVLITTPIDKLCGKELLAAIERKNTVEDELAALEEQAHHHHHHHDHDEECECGHHHHHDHDEECECGHHHHHDHDEECECGHHHHHDHDEECECGHHHHHDHDEECECGHHHHHDHDEECECGHHHHHDHDEECECGHHHHHDHDHDEECECGHHHHHDHHHGEECSCGCGGHHGHHHHADEVFNSVGVETAKKFTKEFITEALEALDEGTYGMVLRAKGIVECECGNWLHFDYVPGEIDVRVGAAAVMGRICVIGAGIDENEIKKLFGVN